MLLVKRQRITGLDLLSSENEYVRNLESYIDIYVIRKNKVTRVFEKVHVGLFQIFIHKHFLIEYIRM